MSRLSQRARRPYLEALEDRIALNAGDLDPTFGSGGVARVFALGAAKGEGIALQPDGKVVMAGSDSLGGADVARFNPNGSLDSTFDGDGVARLPTPVNPAWNFRGVALQTDGKIVASGREAGPNGGTFIARFNGNGSLDTGFGTGGVVRNPSVEVAEVAIQTDGKIVACGFAVVPGGDSRSVLMRFNANGSLDTTFTTAVPQATPGAVLYNLFPGGEDHFHAVAFQPGGQILVAGQAGEMIVARFQGTPFQVPPVARGDSYSTAEDTPLSVAAPGVLANDTDADLDPLAAAVVTPPAHGALSLAADGSFLYTPTRTSTARTRSPTGPTTATPTATWQP